MNRLLTKLERLEEDDAEYIKMRDENDCRLALAALMAAYGNCDIPGALMNLASKPSREVNGIELTERDAMECAMFAAWMRGAKALGISTKPPERKP